VTAISGGPIAAVAPSIPAMTTVVWDGAATPTLTDTTTAVVVAAYSGQAMAGFAGCPQSVLNAIAAVGKNSLEAIPC
jgi:hypothetical protein